jgi:nitrogen PTS system EIIA component
MTGLVDFLSAGSITAGLNVSSRKALFAHISQTAFEQYGLDPALVAEKLTERERLGSTGFGNGIAIPHGKIDGLQHVVGIFAQLAPPVDFQAVDNMPVDIVFCLLSPTDSGAEHLKALALVSRWLRDPGFIARLRGAGTADALYALMESQESRNAA